MKISLKKFLTDFFFEKWTSHLNFKRPLKIFYALTFLQFSCFTFELFPATSNRLMIQFTSFNMSRIFTWNSINIKRFRSWLIEWLYRDQLNEKYPAIINLINHRTYFKRCWWEIMIICYLNGIVPIVDVINYCDN